MRVILTRHGEVEGIDPPRFRGRMQLALTDLGRRQAQALADALATRYQPAAVYTSPMQRCRDTAAVIATVCGGSAYVQPGMDDLDYGQWQWKSHEEALREFPDEFTLWKTAPQWMRFPGGESLQSVALRIADAMRDLLQSFEDETIVLVAHDSVNRVLLTQALDLPLSAYWHIGQGPCCINVLDVYADGRTVVHSVNETAHLAGLMS
ncbi:phosphoglycerate mutase [Caballeronia arationis]|uniref:histidine phosphatase family protein n=1 Tax=Caballeronia arationis TaxID=1777142 RepID=UPI00074BBDC9|nr:histidine phosphatase family protein [Caballeronia arationis]SAK89391.1 phosphoglycerate mutase [Caballeronia arationis]